MVRKFSISCSGLLLFALTAISAPVDSAQAQTTDCSRYIFNKSRALFTSEVRGLSNAFPRVLTSPWNPIDGNTLDIRTFCNSSNREVEVVLANPPSKKEIRAYAEDFIYYYHPGISGGTWKQLNVNPGPETSVVPGAYGNFIMDDYFNNDIRQVTKNGGGTARFTLPQGVTTAYILAWICTLDVESYSWKCSCNDANCNSPYYQVQQVDFK